MDMDVESELGTAAPSVASTGELFMKQARGELGSEHQRASSRYMGGGGRSGGGRLLRSAMELVPSLLGRPRSHDAMDGPLCKGSLDHRLDGATSGVSAGRCS